MTIFGNLDENILNKLAPMGQHPGIDCWERDTTKTKMGPSAA
jgi:hypothetical protein